jgi:predicted metal-dependent peptidase
MKRIATVMLIGLAVGCHTPSKKQQEQMAAEQQQKKEETTRRQQYLEAHPDLSPADKKAIAHGDVVVGMTESDVRASIGEPDQISSNETEHGTNEQWYYKTGSPGKENLNFDAGVLTSWQPGH